MLFDSHSVAVATCHASRCVTTIGADLFYREVIDNVFYSGVATLGDAVCEAKQVVISQNPGDDWLYGPAVLQTILGDPALRLHTPLGVREWREEKKQKIRLSIEPNPFSKRTELSLDLGKKHGEGNKLFHMHVFDICGRSVYSCSIRDRERVGFGDFLPPGIFFLTVSDPKGNTVVLSTPKKIVKLR
jgi:hypothetical protein